MKNIIILFFLAFIVGCGGSAINEIKITEITNSPQFENAILKVDSIQILQNENELNLKLDFNVSNFELGDQTEDATDKGIANSKDGQHIHLIVDNEPYCAHYEPTASYKLDSGNHLVLAFLSRSYHESVKNTDAFFVKEVSTNDETNTFDTSAPHLFYSRPKGTYSDEDTKKVLFDFYLLNTTLSPDGNKVKLTINDTKEFIIDKWAPFYIENLPLGENKIKIQLLDSNGNMVPGPFNETERTFILEEKKK